MSLTKAQASFKPFRYPWAFEAWKRQQQIHWLPEEVPLGDDVKDWNSPNRMTAAEKNLLIQIFRFFTQADREVNDNYMTKLAGVFKPTEIQMMLAAFSNMETVHIVAYSLLMETIGMPDSEYEAFLKIKEMKAKHDYIGQFNTDTPMETAINLAVFGAFIEGMQLFASFAILLNFPRHNKMKGMGQIVTWSVRDESLHCDNIINLYHQWMREHTHIDRAEVHGSILNICEEMVAHEDAFIDIAFQLGPVEGLTADEVKQYIRYIADMRLRQLKLTPIYGVTENPLPWLRQQLNQVEHANFFEARATEYSKAATTGTWDDVRTKRFGGTKP